MAEPKDKDVDGWLDNVAAVVPSLELGEKAADATGDGGSGAGDEEDFLNDNEGAEDGDEGVKKSLTWRSRTGDYEFHLQPMAHCVWVLLLLRFVERATYYGYTLMNPGFLTGKISVRHVFYVCNASTTSCLHIISFFITYENV